MPGFITGMDWSFPDGIWNIEKDFKVPRLITVAMSYTVIHDGNPGIYPFQKWKVNADGTIETDSNSGGRTFGAGKFSNNSSSNTNDKSSRITVTRAEIRKIFDSVRGGDNN